MIEPIFVPGNRPAWLNADGEPQRARDRALLWRATNLAVESAFSFGIDLPVGAVAASDDKIVGRWFASDKRTGFAQTHAEFMAVQDWEMTRLSSAAPPPDTVIVSLEPCDNCQNFLATVPSIKRVGFGLSRQAVEERGLVKPHPETIFQRALRVGLPYEVFQVDDPALQEVGGIILDHVTRNPHTEVVEVDQFGLQKALVALNER